MNFMDNLYAAVASFVAEDITAQELKDWFKVFDQGYRLVEDHAEIPLTRGLWSKVSLADLPAVLNHKWFAVGDGTRSNPWVARAKIKGRIVPLARFILGLVAGDKKIADHKDWNTLNNQRANLRVVNTTQSAQYRRGWKRAGSLSGSKFKGVYGKEGRWRSVIKHNGKSIHLGYFQTEAEAAKAYDLAVEKYHGNYAAKNYPASS